MMKNSTLGTHEHNPPCFTFVAQSLISSRKVIEVVMNHGKSENLEKREAWASNLIWKSFVNFGE